MASAACASRTPRRTWDCSRWPAAISATAATPRASTGARDSSCGRMSTRSSARAPPTPAPRRRSRTSPRAGGWPSPWPSSGISTPPLLEDGVHLSEVLGIHAFLALWTLHKAGGLLAAGEPARAGEAARHALDLAIAHKERGHQAWAWRLLGEVASHEGGAALAQ